MEIKLVIKFLNSYLTIYSLTHLFMLILQIEPRFARVKKGQVSHLSLLWLWPYSRNL